MPSPPRTVEQMNAGGGRNLNLSPAQRRHFLADLRHSRGDALKDAEAFAAIVAAIERLGAFLEPSRHGLHDYKPALRGVAVPEADEGDVSYRAFDRIFDQVVLGRNEALHVGTFARALTSQCAHLALLIEEGLLMNSPTVADLMVPNPACVALWQPVSFARHQMLMNAYSFLPLNLDGRWVFVSDLGVARYLAPFDKRKPRRKALEASLQDAIRNGSLQVEKAPVVDPGATRADALALCGSTPVLIVDNGHLLGIATAFDLL